MKTKNELLENIEKYNYKLTMEEIDFKIAKRNIKNLRKKLKNEYEQLIKLEYEINENK